MFKKFKLTCDEATTICDKTQYGEATFMEKLKLTIHFMHCKICSLYTKQNTLLSGIYKDHASNCKKAKHKMNEADKAELKEKLEKLSA